ncbi:NUDIX domain-containing protein [Ginsengibacter hankyongi]|uniref:NUDIX domain-containing protein n=1 Tax=Ginsengibacter hankyongi TaxID=2607284 RepID=A0A5J5IG68_9BACT|nr:NUDIX domain-containing protein [Ginsengibacter hankyongi]KAA9039081.1 NUDIX domain-containing protein [Ginsengibacter hankyongi]
MAKKQSAGLLLYRTGKNVLEVFLVHPGGPFWKNKDEGAWSIPKGEFGENEEPLKAAIREFLEETGKVVFGKFLKLNPVKQKSGKDIFAWALEKNIDAAQIVSNNFEMEWPPHSGKFQNFPEVDRGEWFLINEAKKKINAAQVSLLTELEEKAKT